MLQLKYRNEEIKHIMLVYLQDYIDNLHRPTSTDINDWVFYNFIRTNVGFERDGDEVLLHFSYRDNEFLRVQLIEDATDYGQSIIQAEQNLQHILLENDLGLEHFESLQTMLQRLFMIICNDPIHLDPNLLDIDYEKPIEVNVDELIAPHYVDTCAICLENYDKVIPSYKGTCTHTVCEDCFRTLVEKQKHNRCPMCRAHWIQ